MAWPAALTVLSREDCELCEQMHAALAVFTRHHDLPPPAIVDVDGDAQLRRRYGLKVPVLLLDGLPVCHGRFDEAELRRLLRL